jgi:outer membrane receptor for ferrienterochelin and colicin
MMQFSIKPHFILLLLYLLTNSIYSQDNQVIISGFIRDASSGEMLIGTNILLYKDSLTLDNPAYRGASSNKHGFFAIPKISKGKYFLLVSNLGYKTKIEELLITINSGTLGINLELIPENVELKEIIVRGEEETKSKISTIDIMPELLEQLPSYSGEVDLFKSLQTISGVKTASELSTGLYVRGGSPDQTLTLVDGVIVYNPTHLGNFASTFNSSAIQNVRLIKGAFPAEYGGRLSSVLDIKLRAGTKEKDKRKIGLGLVNSYFMLEGPLRDNSTYMLFGRMMYYDVLQKKFDEKSTAPRYNFKDINTKLTYTLNESNVLSVSGMLTYDDLYSPSHSDDIDYDIGWENKTISLNWLKIGSNSLFLNNSISYVNYKFRSLLRDNKEISNSSDYFASSNLDDILIKTNADIYWNEDNILKVGGEIAVHYYDLIYSDNYDPLIEIDKNSTTEIFATEATLYVQNAWEISNGLDANFGGRLYYFNNSKYLNFEPRLSLSYNLNKYVTLKTAYAVAHQFLHLIVRNDISLPTDLWYPSTSNIKPSKSSQYVFGIESQFDEGKYLFSIESYYKDMKNLYEFRDGANLGLNNSMEDLFTKGEGEAYGLELFLNKRAGNIFGWVGYTLSWTKRQFADLNIGNTFFPRYDRRHDISIVLGYKILDNISFGATWVYSSGQGFTIPTGQYSFEFPVLGTREKNQFDYTDRNDFRMPSYHKLDINLTYKFKYGSIPLQAYVNLLNVYNRKNAFAYYISPEQNDESSENTASTMKQITLFPFIPTIGLNIEF